MLEEVISLGEALGTDSRSPRFESMNDAYWAAMRSLHARTCLHARGVLALLSNGLVDPAWPQWRVCHESSTIARFIAEKPEMVPRYLNYLEDPDHLIAVSSRDNRSKGARDPEEWMPPDETYWCEYAQDWAEIKARWELTMTDAEAEAVMDMLWTCENPPEVVVSEALESATGEYKPEPAEEPQNSVYGSCQEAGFAGESRFQGSQGGGLGYPKAMVPSARDGDRDGIVCEKTIPK